MHEVSLHLIRTVVVRHRSISFQHRFCPLSAFLLPPPATLSLTSLVPTSRLSVLRAISVVVVSSRCGRFR